MRLFIVHRRTHRQANPRAAGVRAPIAAIVALLAVLVAPAHAAPLAPKGTYTLDPDHAHVLFSVRHMALSSFYGEFGKVTGTLTFDQTNPEKCALSVQIDMHGIDTHVPELDERLTDSVFQVDKYPTASFTATKIARTGDKTGTVTGDLTLAGVTKPVTLSVTFNGGNGTGEQMQPYRIGFDATATVKRSDFGLTHMIWTGFISDDVQLLIEAEAVRR